MCDLCDLGSRAFPRSNSAAKLGGLPFPDPLTAPRVRCVGARAVSTCRSGRTIIPFGD